ncbi:unnamed protein product [Caenorhabditis sp. 36 PRJEB53466]|nr:unnamed protein product [Caenorhabditis sp. 36 PRJEB53466]
MAEKLKCLQGLRGISIILVTVFHLFPLRFVNGFVGVDIFFVLSGYLMTRILTKGLGYQSVIEFYKKRFIRIVPLYYLTILATITGVLCLVLKSERCDFIQDVLWSLPLISNFQPIFEHHTYWQQVSSIRYLTHLWSLCTELQYYLIAPLIHFIASRLAFPNRILAYSVAIVSFFCFQLLTPFESPPLVFVGDLSFVIYLLHWPIINFVKYIQQKDHTELNWIEALVAVLLTISLSLLTHYFLEKTTLNLNFVTNFTLSFFVLGLCYSMTNWLQLYQCLSLNSLPNFLQERVQFNLNTSNLLINLSRLPCHVNEKKAKLSIDMFGIEYCAHRSNGTGKVLVIGNSASIRAFPMIFNLFDGRYEEIRLFAKHGGAPLLNVWQYYTDAAKEMAEEMRPDALWIIQGVHEILHPDVHPGKTLMNFDPSHLDVVVTKQMNEFKMLAGLVFVDLPYFIAKDFPAKLIARSLIYRKDIEEKLSVSLEEVEEQIGEQRERIRSQNCSNCYFNDIQKALTNGEKRYYLYERSTFKVLNYDGGHLSLTAYEHIRPIYQSRIDQLLDFIAKST